MTLWLRRDCFRSIEVLSFMIPTLTMVFVDDNTHCHVSQVFFGILHASKCINHNGFCIYDQNMEFRRGRGNGWFVLGVCSTNAVEDEGFLLEIACELIGGTPQKEGIQVMFRENQE